MFEWHKLIGFVFLFSLMCTCEHAYVHKLPAVHILIRGKAAYMQKNATSTA